MDNLENQPASSNRDADLQAQINGLKQLVSSALVLIFIVSGAMNIYFWRQLRSVRAELNPMREKSAQITAEVNKVNATANEFARRLVDYGKTHPQFVPILDKYNLRAMPGATNAPAPATAPAQKAPPAATKK